MVVLVLCSLSGNDSRKMFLVIKHALQHKTDMSSSQDITTGTSQCAGGRKEVHIFSPPVQTLNHQEACLHCGFVVADPVC